MPEQITFLRRVIDFLIPRKCPACGRRLPISDKVICSECYFNLPRTNFHIFPEDSFIVRKYSKMIPVVRVASFFYYTTKSESSRIILQMKYFGKWSFAEYISRLYTYEIKDSGFFEGIDVIVPVPLTKKREKERGYNQSYHIAIGISEATGIPIITDAIRRVVFTESQTRKSKEERQTNVADAFRLVSSAGIEGKHVLLVDDVITTGATIFSCAGELLKGGVKCFSILSLAHTRHL